MLRKLVVLALILVVVATAFASAASLTLSGGTIQAGVDGDLQCDPDGVWVDGWGLETDENLVYFVRIDGINGACIANEMFIKVMDGGGDTLAYGSVTISGQTAKLNFANPVEPEAIEGVMVWIEGAQ